MSGKRAPPKTGVFGPMPKQKQQRRGTYSTEGSAPLLRLPPRARRGGTHTPPARTSPKPCIPAVKQATRMGVFLTGFFIMRCSAGIKEIHLV